jgi:hypothetical protein
MTIWKGKIVERFRDTRDYSAQEQGKPQYDSIDLSPYLQDRSQTARGLFLLHVRAVRYPRNEDSDGSENLGFVPIEDQRLILVTDLGFIVKQTKEGARDVFVQSLRSGEPVVGARIQMIGRNGLPVQAASTDATGHAQLPRPPNELNRQTEKTPLIVLVQKDDDFSFLPLWSRGPPARLFTFRHRRCGKCAVRSDSLELLVHRSGDLSPGRDHTPGADYPHCRLERNACRTSTRSRDYRFAGCVGQSHVADSYRLQRSRKSRIRVSLRRPPERIRRRRFS